MGKLDELVRKGKTSARLCAEACADLKDIGLNARIVKEDRPEKRVGLNPGEAAKGHLIQIPNSPISWINIIWRWPFDSVMTSSVSQESPFYFVYLISNPELRFSHRRSVIIKPVKERRIPLMGSVSAVRWKGVYADDIIQQLKNDIIINQFLVRGRHNIRICSYPDHGFWAINEEGFLWPKLSREKWECFKRIAKHLLEGKAGN
jgi:hypothetical protein